MPISQALATSVFAVTCVVDVTIAATICYLLITRKSEMEMSLRSSATFLVLIPVANLYDSTNRMIKHLIILSINSGTWTSIFAIGSIISVTTSTKEHL